MERWVKCPIKENCMHAFNIKYDRKRKTYNERNICKVWLGPRWQIFKDGTIIPNFIR